MSENILDIKTMNHKLHLRMDYITGWLKNSEINYLEIYFDIGKTFSFAVENTGGVDFEEAFAMNHEDFADLCHALNTDVLSIMTEAR